MKRLFLFIALAHCFVLEAQTVRTPVAALYPSLNTYSVQQKDAFSFRSNSASLAGIKSFAAGVFSERRFLLKELSSYSVVAALPTASGAVGLRGDYFGEVLYNESGMGLAYGRSLGTKADVGLGFHYFSMKAAGYGAAATVTFDAGAVLYLSDVVQAGVSVYNPVGMKLGKGGEEKLPSIYSFGIGYDASPQAFIGAEVQKTEDQPVSVNAGLQYLFAEKLIARSGFSSAASVYYLGFGVKLQKLRIDVAASVHPYLGVTPGLLLLYSSK